jgi:ABC-type glycerol-3-phosphate transport system substrate-binding protein
MKKFLIMLLTALMVLSFTGCNKPQEEEKASEIVFWHTLTDHDEQMVREIVAAFNAEYEGKYHVTQETQPLDGFSGKVYEAVTNGVGPNLVWLYPNTAQDYIDAGLSLDYSKYFSDADYKNRVSAGVYAASTEYADGGLHAVIATITGSIMFYNKELLEKYNLEIPTTWDELLAACKTVVDGEKAEGNDIMGFGPDSVDVVGIVVLEQLGLHYIDGNHTAADWTNEKFANWLRWWKEAEDAGYFQLVDSEGYHSGPFGNQKYFCYMGSSAGMGYITPNGFTIVTGPVPQVAGGKQYTEITTRALVGFTKDDATDAGTAEFVKFFTKAENNLPFCQKYSASTPYKDVEESAVYKDYFNNSIANQALAGMLSYAGTRPSVSGEGGAKEALVAALRKIIIDNADVASTLADAQATANSALSD